MKIPFLSRWLAAAATAALTIAAPGLAQAQSTYPERPVHIVYPYAAGSDVEAFLRALSEDLTKTLGQQVLVDVRPGAATRIGAQHVLSAKPDGHTLLFGDLGGTFAIATLRPNAPLDARKDFAPITTTLSGPPFLLVRPDSPIQSFEELVALSKSNPGGVKYGSNGVGSSFHLVIERLTRLADFGKTVHVPYKGSPEVNLALLGGQIDFSLNTGLVNIKAGRGRPLAVLTPQRSPLLPDVPTLRELIGQDAYQEQSWWLLAAPKGTPAAVIDRLNEAVRIALAKPEITTRFEELGNEFAASTPAEAARLISSEIDKWQQVIQEAGIELQ